MKKGFHRFGINKDTVELQKYDFENWSKAKVDKHWTEFEINYNRNTLIKFEIEENILWNSQLELKGQLWFENETFREETGATWFQNRMICFYSQNIFLGYAHTNEFSKFILNGNYQNISN